MNPEQEKNQTPLHTEHAQSTPPEHILEPADGDHLLPAAPFYLKKGFWVKIIFVLLFIGVAGYFVYTSGILSPAVATVNGVKISQAELDENVAMIEEAAVIQGIDISEVASKEMVTQQALDVLIHNLLLVNAAEAEGIVVTQEEIDEIYEELIASVGGPEKLQENMDGVNLTEEKLKENIVERIIADKYLEVATDIETLTVSDAEIQAVYETFSASSEGDLPPIEAIGEEIRARLLLQKQQEIVNAVLTDLKANADIEINL